MLIEQLTVILDFGKDMSVLHAALYYRVEYFLKKIIIFMFWCFYTQSIKRLEKVIGQQNLKPKVTFA